MEVVKGCSKRISVVSVRRTHVACHAKHKDQPQQVRYGAGWYERTREAMPTKRKTVSEQLKARREANLKANNGKERKDLYTDNWDGDKYKGNPVNVLSVIVVVSILTPLAGLAFAYASYGKLWG